MRGYVGTRAVQSETRDAALICPTTRTWMASNLLPTTEWLASIAVQMSLADLTALGAIRRIIVALLTHFSGYGKT